MCIVITLENYVLIYHISVKNREKGQSQNKIIRIVGFI